ncbi:uncharacterized protein I303_101177 [Kwoniella dejecticola CBS 10117]|uniref:Major facilitator superfamily (MFS) profile domain-containing protein n=1 Tax=Kwoniella dejecticola CBS 10117 TaxID=1296121 RepID=A0A1A6AH14_9TREE|nr:uncharacterized protein I303_01184 [Kwoniella dejecticola CBS 10117]OBR89357.1 hypothetical protein I303_01184 [Kwoniella dejecticola CBS 10117]
MSLRTALTAIWAALHTTQYGFAITSLNGVQGPVTCGGAGGAVTPHSLALASPGLKDCIQMSPAEFGLVTSIFTLGGLLGSLAANSVTHRVGRIGTLRVSALCVLVGSAIMGLADSMGVMVAARILIGLGCGLSTVTVPLVLSEIAPPSIKRALGIMNQIFIVIGMLIAQSLSFPFAKPYVWRYVFTVSIGIAVIQLLGSLAVRLEEKAEIVVGDEENDEETSLLPSDGQKPLSIKELLLSKDPLVTRGLLVVLITQLSQQFCGVSPVMYFSTRILTPVFQSNSRLIALFIIITKIPITCLPAFLIERLGSRRLLIYPTCFMSIAAVVLAFGINYDAQALSVIGVFSFVIAFSVGLGPVTWVVLPEVMPKHAVTAAGSIGLAVNWSLNFCMGAIFLPLQRWMSGGKDEKEGNIFFVLAATCVTVVIAMSMAFKAQERVAI